MPKLETVLDWREKSIFCIFFFFIQSIVFLTFNVRTHSKSVRWRGYTRKKGRKFFFCVHTTQSHQYHYTMISGNICTHIYFRFSFSFSFLVFFSSFLGNPQHNKKYVYPCCVLLSLFFFFAHDDSLLPGASTPFSSSDS